MNADPVRELTQDERDLINHVCRWGSDGYPVRKLGRGWTWGPWRSIAGPPTMFRTKREAVASFERFHEVLLEALGAESRRRELEEATRG